MNTTVNAAARGPADFDRFPGEFYVRRASGLLERSYETPVDIIETKSDRRLSRLRSETENRRELHAIDGISMEQIVDRD